MLTVPQVQESPPGHPEMCQPHSCLGWRLAFARLRFSLLNQGDTRAAGVAGGTAWLLSDDNAVGTSRRCGGGARSPAKSSQSDTVSIPGHAKEAKHPSPPAQHSALHYNSITSLLGCSEALQLPFPVSPSFRWRSASSARSINWANQRRPA